MEEQILKDFIATVQANDYNYDVAIPKFPELKGIDLQVLKDYVATAEANNYDYSVINPKFPEFGFGDVKKKVDLQSVQEPKDTMVSTGEESPASLSSSASQPSEVSTEETIASLGEMMQGKKKQEVGSIEEIVNEQNPVTEEKQKAEEFRRQQQAKKVTTAQKEAIDFAGNSEYNLSDEEQQEYTKLYNKLYNPKESKGDIAPIPQENTFDGFSGVNVNSLNELRKLAKENVIDYEYIDKAKKKDDLLIEKNVYDDREQIRDVRYKMISENLLTPFDKKEYDLITQLKEDDKIIALYNDPKTNKYIPNLEEALNIATKRKKETEKNIAQYRETYLKENEKDIEKARLELANDPDNESLKENLLKAKTKYASFINPVEAAKKIYEDNPEIEKAKGDTPMEKFLNYFDAAVLQYEDAKKEMTNKNIALSAIPLIDEMSGASEDVRRYAKAYKKIEELAPIALLNRKALSEDNFFSQLGKSFSSGLTDGTLFTTEAEQSDIIFDALDKSKTLNNVSKEQVEALEASFNMNNYEKTASTLGSTLAIMPAFMGGGAAVKGLKNATKIGKAFDKVKDMNKATRLLLGAAESGVSYEAASIFGDEAVEDEASFVSGALGEVFSQGLSAVAKRNIVMSAMVKAFGKNASKAQRYMAITAQRSGQGFGEVAEEYGNEIGSIINESDGSLKKMQDLYLERFGTLDQNIEFGIMTFGMGVLFGSATKAGQAFADSHKDWLSKQSDSVKENFNKLSSEVSSDISKVAEEVTTGETEQIALEEPTADQLQSDIDNGEVVTIMFTDENEIPDVYKEKTKVENSIRNIGTIKVGMFGKTKQTYMVTVEKSLADYHESIQEYGKEEQSETPTNTTSPATDETVEGIDVAGTEVREGAGDTETEQATGEVAPEVEAAPNTETELTKTTSLETISEKYPDVTIDVFEDKKNKILNLGRIIVPEGSRGKGIGTRSMQDLVDYADKNNLKFTLTPSKEFGATSVTRLKKFYKQFGFVENKGRNRDFSHKESMYRVPELKETDKDTEQVTEQEVTKKELTIFRGLQPKMDAEGNETTAHKLKDEKWKFGSAKIEGTDGYKGTKPIKKFTIPVGTTIETVKLPGNTPAATSRVDLETAAIDNSTAQVVKLETIDASGKETQYIIKDDSLIESGVDMTAEEEASAREPKTEPKKRKSKTQKAVDDFVEKKMSSKKDVSISEKEGLKKQIRDFARGMREAYKDQRTFKKKANKLISDNLQLFGNLSPSKVKALTRRALNIDFSKPGSLDKFIEYAASLEQITEDKLYQDIVSSIKNKTAPSKLKKRKSGVVKGKIANYEGKVLSSIHSAIKEGDIDAIENRIKALKEKENQTGSLSEGETALLESSLISIELLSGDLKTAQSAQKKIDELIDGGKSKYREDVKRRSQEYKELVEKSIPVIAGGKKITDQFGKLEQGAKRRPLADSIREKLSGFLDWGEGLRTLLDKIDRTATRDESGYGGFLDKELYEPVADGRRKKDNLDTAKVNELSAKLEELYGKRKKKELQKNRESQNLGTFTNRKGNQVNLFLSQNQAYPLYQYMQDPSNMKTFEAMGFTNEMLEAVENFLTPEVKKWADWQMSEFFPKYFNEINVVYKEMNDIDLPRQKIYVPIVRKATELSEKEVGIDQIAFGNPQSTYKSLNQRQNSKAEFDMSKDGNEKLMEYVEGMNTYIAFAKPVKKLNIVFKNRGVRNAIKEFNSKETMQAIDGFIERIANNSSDLGKRIAILDKIRGNVTIASLALAPTVTIKQLTSIPAYASDIPIKKFLSGMGAFAKNPMKAAEILMESEYMQKRYKDGFERDILEGMKRDYDGMLRGTSNLKNKMMFLIKWGDKGAILMGGYSVYKYHFDKAIAENKGTKEAKSIALSKFEEATKLSQQSTNPEDISMFQAMGSLGKMFTMYMTSPISYFRQERKSARDFVKGFKSKNKKLMKNAVKRFVTYHFVLPIVFQYVANGLPGLLTDWDDDDEKDLKRAASIGSLNGIFIAGQLISYLGDILTDKAWASGGKFSPSPAIDAVADIVTQAGQVANEWSENPYEFSDDLMKEMIDLGFSLDVAVGMPANRVKNLIENWSMISDDNSLETREKIALGLGYSPYVVTPRKMKKGKGSSVKVGRTEAQEKQALKETDPVLYRQIYGK